jgi:hypothetical protein
MKNFKSLFTILILSYTLVPAVSQTNSGKTAQVKTSGIAIPFELINNKSTIQARIGDSRLIRIVLDTGMGWDGMVITNPDLADSIDLISPMEASIGGAGNSDEATAVFSDSMTFTISSKEFKDQRVVILRQGGFRGGSFDGVTGYSIFGHYTVEVNYDRSEITLYQPGELKHDNSWTEIPIYFGENLIPWIDVSIVIENEKPIPISCYIDYASSEALELLIKSDQKFKIPAKTEDYYLGRGLSGDINGRKGKISKVIIGPYVLGNVNAAFAPAEVRSKQKGADGVISNNLLRRFNLIFDYSERRVFLKPNSYFNEPF